MAKTVKIIIKKNGNECVDEYEDGGMQKHMDDIESKFKVELEKKRQGRNEKNPNDHSATFVAPKNRDEIWFKCVFASIDSITMLKDRNYDMVVAPENPFIFDKARADRGKWIKASFNPNTKPAAVSQCFYKYEVVLGDGCILDPHINVDDDHELMFQSMMFQKKKTSGKKRLKKYSK